MKAIVDTAALVPKPLDVSFLSWLDEKRSSHVVSALPAALWNKPTAIGSRIGTLSSHAGDPRWWRDQLFSAPLPSSSSTETDATMRYDHDDLFAWFPAHDDVDPALQSIEFDRISLAGTTVTVHAMPTKRLLFELEAAANGTGPAIFAASGPVVVSQLHSFRLSDLLAARNAALADPLRTEATFDATIFESTAAIVRKLRALATNRVVKLNVTADSVVFCPRLAGGDDGDDGGESLSESGYGFDGMQSVRGLPYLRCFDLEFTKRVPNSIDSYSADSAYVLMTAVLLTTVRAEFGGSAARLMLRKLKGCDVDGRCLSADELPELFEPTISITAAATRAMSATSATSATSADFLTVFSEPTAQDFHLQSELSELLPLFASESTTATTDRHFLSNLAKHLLDSSHTHTNLFASVDLANEASVFARDVLLEKRLGLV